MRAVAFSSSSSWWLALVGVIALVACSAAEVDGDERAAGRSPAANSTSGGPPPPKTLESADAGSSDAASACETARLARCGVDPQCGCAANETCDITDHTSGAVSCVTGGSATLGRPCTATGDCAAGLTCRYGACRPYCTAPRSKCGVSGTELCVEVLGNDHRPEPNNAVCTIKCDPRNPSAVCGTGTCLWFATYYSPAKVGDCHFPGAGDLYAKCSNDYDCKPGMACIDHPSPTVGLECEKWCRVGVAGDCPQGFTCRDVFGANAPVVDGVKEGICQDS